ncbi:FHA domain-containing protein [Nocardia vaccinii]|uniref:FHA domain-containing protein n=1 Tax=Nocardia vaccinii TaxID=1822 RepID=UPI0008320B3D|nr:FHA domain-containing protein [Nocardia vaccinii]
MLTCPDGHPSAATDYCDVCGAAMSSGPAPVRPAAAPLPCPSCGAPISARFCEVCGHDSALPAAASFPAQADPAAAVSESAAPTVEFGKSAPNSAAGELIWVATVVADGDLYQRMLSRKGPDAERVEFPGYYPERRIPLRGSDFLIGKRSVSQGVLPDIDLGIAPVDIGVSRSHARIHIDRDVLTVTDLGSTNGTSLNGIDDLIPPGTPVPLHSGDRIHVGGWTTITVTYESA